MGEINIPRAEREALKAIDSTALSRLIDKCIDEQNSNALQSLRLAECGTFVATNLRQFESAILAYDKSKAPKNRTNSRTDAVRAGNDLLYAVQQMQVRVEVEEKQDEFFYVDDIIQPPFTFTEWLTVRVMYRWRTSVENSWMHESIEFSYKYEPRQDYLNPQPARKRSSLRQARDMQDKLYAEWEHLKRLALWSVRDYLKSGGDGAAIPKTFQVRVDDRTRGLNNFSARFWVK